MSRVGLDVDDVLRPWYERAHAASVEARIDNGIVPKSWHPFREYGCTDQQWYDALEVATLSGELYNAPPYEGTREQMVRLLDGGHSIHIVTACGFLAHGNLIKRQTIAYFEHWDLPHDTFTFSVDKTVIPTDWFLDDSIRNYDSLAATGRTRVRLLNRPHNEVSGPCHRRRVNTLAEFVDEVLA